MTHDEAKEQVAKKHGHETWNAIGFFLWEEKLIAEAAELYARSLPVPFQKCPKCDGQGTVSKPPWVAGDLSTWSEGTGANHTCNVCNGAKVIPMFIPEFQP